MKRLAIVAGLTTFAISINTEKGGLSNVRQQRCIDRNPFRRPLDGFGSPRCTTLLSRLMLAAFILLHAGRVSAQQASASIKGVINDPTGAVVAGATITLTALDTNVVRTTTSNAAGIYVFVNIPPARYALKVVKERFTSASQSNFEVFVGQTAAYDFRLAVGAKQDAIIVSAQDADLVSSTAELGTVLSERAVADLPLNGRNFTQLLPLTPGVSPISVAQNAGGGAFAGNAIGSFTFPAVNGQRNRSNMFLLDGVNDLGSFIGNYDFAPIIDTVQEFKVQSHNDEAEFGQVLGGIVNVVSKAGTNTYRASLWEFVRNQQFDARKFFAARRDPLRQNQFGLTGGGPLWIPKLYNGTNRTFFYGGYEGYRQSQASSTPILVPTEGELTGNFSGDGPIIYNAFTTRPDPNNPGSYLRTPFAGNIIPPSMLSPASLEWAKLFSAPGSSTLAGYNSTNTTPEHTNQDSYQMRLDQVFSTHDVLFARISYYTQTQNGQPSLSGGALPGAIQELNLIGWNGAVHETHSFGPSAVLDLHFARNWGDDQNDQNVLNAPANFANDLIASGFAPSFISDYRGGAGPYIPTVGISGYASSGQHIQDTRISDTWEFGGDFTKLVGRHTIKMGAQFETNNTRSPLYYSVVNFTSYETSNLESPGRTGNALASFLLGVPDNALRRNVLVTTHGGWVDGAYIQDQWRVSDRMTLNIGLRWDVTLWPIYGTQGAPDSYVGDLNLNNGTYILANVPPACSPTVGFPCIPGGVLPAHVVVTGQQNGAILHNSFDNWQGRFGFAFAWNKGFRAASLTLSTTRGRNR
jgi:Carboxypeptidase regulatory-like domain